MKIVLDLETQRTFDDVGGRNYEDLLVSVVGVYRYDTDSYECYLEQDLPRLENLLIDCELIVGFNHRKFDLPVLQRYFKLDGARLPMLDLMESITETLGHRVSLESVAQATLGVGKTGHGLDAIDFFQRGEWDKLKSYCLNDVKITKEVYEYGVQNGYVYYLTRDGTDRKSLKVQWGDHEKPLAPASPAAQYNLGF